MEELINNVYRERDVQLKKLEEEYTKRGLIFDSPKYAYQVEANLRYQNARMLIMISANNHAIELAKLKES